MPRKKYHRRMAAPPAMLGFKPFGIPFVPAEGVSMLLEEFEALRLCDYLGNSQEEAAQGMGVSRPTLTRIVDSARKKIARAFVEGRALIIEGGHVEMEANWYRCRECHSLFHTREEEASVCPGCSSENIDFVNAGTGRSENNMNQQRQGMGQGGFCVCTKCGTQVPHRPGFPCKEERCPACQRTLVREGSYHHQLFQEKRNRREMDTKKENGESL